VAYKLITGTHPGFQFLDIVGPTAAFEIASRYVAHRYALEVLAPTAGKTASSSGSELAAGPLEADGLDTIIVSGGQLVWDMAAFYAVTQWLKTVRPRRLASVCSGAFLLAEAGRLDGRLATTHWESTERFRHSYPRVRLEPDRMFTKDGDAWTSAGISAGIDLALALIEDDHGPKIARRTAQQLVVHSRRPGGQSQFSGLLELGGQSGRFEALVAWVKENLDEALTIERSQYEPCVTSMFRLEARTSQIVDVNPDVTLDAKAGLRHAEVRPMVTRTWVYLFVSPAVAHPRRWRTNEGEPPRKLRRLFGLSYAAMAGCSSAA